MVIDGEKKERGRVLSSKPKRARIEALNYNVNSSEDKRSNFTPTTSVDFQKSLNSKVIII